LSSSSLDHAFSSALWSQMYVLLSA
jgi:hypothetical protein